jgi:hypothetical protein
MDTIFSSINVADIQANFIYNSEIVACMTVCSVGLESSEQERKENFKLKSGRNIFSSYVLCDILHVSGPLILLVSDTNLVLHNYSY